MKKFALSIITLLLIYSSFIIAGNKNGYNISVKVKGISQGNFQLANYYGDNKYLKDSALVDSNGYVTFSGDHLLEEGIYLVITPEKKYFEFIMDNNQKFSLETDTTDFVKFMKVKGSPENEIFYEYMNFLNPRGKEVYETNEKIKQLEEAGKKEEAKRLKEKNIKIDEEVKNYKLGLIKKYPDSFVSVFIKSMEEPEIPEPPIINGKIDSTFKFNYYKTHYWDNIDFTDERIVRTPIYHNKLKRFLENMTLQIPDSINATADIILSKARQNSEIYKYTMWWITNTYERSKIMCMDAVFVHMVDSYYKKGYAYWIDSLHLEKIIKRSDQLKLSLCGNKIPNMVFKDAGMKNIPLGEVRAKYTVIFIWDPDCGHCKKEAPKLLELYHKLKNKGLMVYAICSQVDQEKWVNYITEQKLDWINVWDPYNTTNFRHIFDVYSTPVIYLLNEKKEIIAKRIGVEQIEEIINKQNELLDK